MGEMREFFEPYKEKHKQRVKKTPERLEYAKTRLDKANIPYFVSNEETGFLKCWRKSDDREYHFYVGTGTICKKAKNGIFCKIKERGIANLVRILRN